MLGLYLNRLLGLGRAGVRPIMCRYTAVFWRVPYAGLASADPSLSALV